MNSELRVGVIIRTHGIRGEVKVYPTTDSPDRFDVLKKCMLRLNGRYELHEIEQVRHFKNLVILKLRGIDSIEQAEPWKGADLMISREDGAELAEGEYYIADIIGMRVVADSGEELGTVRDVLETGANDVYLVERPGQKDLMLPAIRDCILNTDIVDNVMTVHLMDGLLDL